MQDAAGSALDLAQSPRRAFIVTLQLSALLAAGIPLVAVTQPFLPSVPGAAVLLLAVVLLAIPFWRSATDLHGHVKAGAQVLLEALTAQGGAKDASLSENAEARRLVPGLGEAATLRLPEDAPAVGHSLAELNLRGLTGASVIAVERHGQIIYPGAHDRLEAGDILVFTGTDDAVPTARKMLKGLTPAPLLSSAHLLRCVMYLEVYCLTKGATNLAKAVFPRNRPFAYNDEYSAQERYEFQGDEAPEGKTSFFSGHASSAFASAVFLSKVYTDLYGKTALGYAIWGTSLSLAAATACSRVLAGEHFLSDALMGAAVGSAVGYLVPALHKAGSEKAAVSVLPGSVLLVYRY